MPEPQAPSNRLARLTRRVLSLAERRARPAFPMWRKPDGDWLAYVGPPENGGTWVSHADYGETRRMAEALVREKEADVVWGLLSLIHASRAPVAFRRSSDTPR